MAMRYQGAFIYLDRPCLVSGLRKSRFLFVGCDPLQALVVNEFHGASNFVFTAPVKSVDLPPLRVTGDLILCEFGFQKDKFTYDTLILLMIGIICALATIFFLEFSGMFSKDHKQQVEIAYGYLLVDL